MFVVAADFPSQQLYYMNNDDINGAIFARCINFNTVLFNHFFKLKKLYFRFVEMCNFLVWPDYWDYFKRRYWDYTVNCCRDYEPIV